MLGNDQSAERGLLMVVLALIQLAGGKLSEGEGDSLPLLLERELRMHEA